MSLAYTMFSSHSYLTLACIRFHCLYKEYTIKTLKKGPSSWDALICMPTNQDVAGHESGRDMILYSTINEPCYIGHH